MEAKRRPRDVGKTVNIEQNDIQGQCGLPIIKQMFSKARTSSLEIKIARNRSQIGTKLWEGESGKQDELKSEQ